MPPYLAIVKFIPFIKAIVFLILAGIALQYQHEYTEFSSQFVAPEKLAPTIYRVALAFFFLEAGRFLIITFYKTQGRARRDNFTIGVSHLAKIIYALLVGLLVLSLFNISLKEAITSLSLIAAAIVLITKDYISNLINGMYLTLAKVVNIGDSVQIENNKGKIMDITLTNVHLLNDDDDIIYIPNNKVFSSEIINYTRRELKKSSVEFEIDVNYVPEVEALEKDIIQSLGDLNEIIQPGTQILKVQAIRQEYTYFKFQYVLKDPLNKEQDKKVRKHVIRYIVYKITQLREKHV